MKIAFWVMLLALSVRCPAQTAFYFDSQWHGHNKGTADAPWTALGRTQWSAINSALRQEDVTLYFTARAADAPKDALFESNGAGRPPELNLTQKAKSDHYLKLDGMSLYNASETAPRWLTNSGPCRCLLTSINSENRLHEKISNVIIHGFRIIATGGRKCITIAGDNWIVECCDCSAEPGSPKGPCVLVVPTADKVHEGSGLYAPPCANIIIRSNNIHHTCGEGIYVGGGGKFSTAGESGAGYPSHSHILIQGNIIHDCGTVGRQGDGIDVKGGIQDLIIEGNNIYAINDPSNHKTRPIVLQGQLPGVHQTTIIRDNYIHDSWGVSDAGISLCDTWGVPQGVQIYNNVLCNLFSTNGTTPAGIMVYSSQDPVLIQNNTIYHCQSYAIAAGKTARLAVTNNLFLDNGNGESQVRYARGSVVASDYNAYTGSAYGGDGPHSLALSPASLSSCFINLKTEDFRLLPGCPLVGKGTPSPNFSKDIMGNPRGPSWDLGAWSVSGQK